MAEPLNLFDRLIVGIDMERPRCWRDDAANLGAFDAWDAAQRRKHGWFAGFRLFGRTNEPMNWLIASRHWPHKLCWDWSVTAGIRRPNYDGPLLRLSFVFSRKYRWFHISLIIFKLRVSWQDYGYMPAPGADKAEAPRVIFGRHLANVDPAGSA